MSYTKNTNPSFWKNHRRDCNCGSFALNINTWFTPYDNNDVYTDKYRTNMIQEMYDEGFSLEEIYDAILEMDQAEILNECSWIEPVDLKDAKDSDRLIAYRVLIDEDLLEAGEVDEDYHFRVRINGFWFEKCGEDPIRFCGTEIDEEPWESTPYLVYDSDIKYFRFKEI